MALSEAKCTNCGANIQVDPALDAAVCSYCGAAFIVEKAINNYNIANAQITAQTVNVNIGSGDFVIEGGVLKKYKGAAMDIIIPEGIAAIGVDAFNGFNRITSVTFSEGVEVIEHGAFYGCSCLKKVVLPQSLKIIRTNAFAGCGLTEIVIPKNVEVIGKNSFGGCYEIKKITILTPGFTDGVTNGLTGKKERLIYDTRADISIACILFPNIFSGTANKTCLSNVDLVWEGSGVEKFTILGTKTINGSPTRAPGCYIATAVYGSYDAPEVFILRHFRDDVLAKTKAGNLFIKTYYRFSPPIARWLKHSRRLNAVVRRLLDILVVRLSNKYRR
jgi:hypothetical protein